MRAAERGAIRAARISAAALVLAAVVAGCGLIPLPSAPSSVPPVGPGMLDLNVSNGTTLPVTIVVNGLVAGVAQPGQDFGPLGADLPPMPWTVEARTASGRLLTTMLVRREDISLVDVGNGATRESGAGARVDLSCGRLDLWVGVPMSGPVPGPGTPGDCAP